MANEIRKRDYYATYHGHEISHLDVVHRELRRSSNGIIFLAGDSSLDNKFWFNESGAAVNGMERILTPPLMKKDVCFWLNSQLAEQGLPSGCVNTAIEATALSDRAFGCLLPQDNFIRDHIGPDDILIVSVGGNDIALKPLLCTALNIMPLVYCTPSQCFEQCACACPPNLGVDCGCMCCGLPGSVVGLCAWPPGFGYFVDLFKNQVENYIKKLVGRRKPRKVLVNMIYYPDQVGAGSWADCALNCLCYDKCPGQLQLAIRKAFEHGTRKIKIPGTEVVPVPLFEVLDPSVSDDYTQRVEPSVQGGRKMAARFLGEIFSGSGEVPVGGAPSFPPTGESIPLSARM